MQHLQQITRHNFSKSRITLALAESTCSKSSTDSCREMFFSTTYASKAHHEVRLAEPHPS
jgi:hypothetical protein